MIFSSRRVWWLAGGVGLLLSGVLGVACSSNPVDDTVGDSGGDSTTEGGGGDSGGGDGGGSDGPTPMTCEAGISGSCDVYLQDCPTGQECTAFKQTDGGYTLKCITNKTGSIKEGYACTPSGSGNNCVAGLECIEHRCARHCCIGDDAICGKAQPEGFTGKCDVNVTVDGTNTAYSVCTYNKPCQPYQIQPCGPGLECLVQDMSGTASCSAYANGGDSGLAEKAPCQYANDCNDGMGCYGTVDAGSKCEWNCYLGGGPFDAGIKDAGAGKGGCPGGETCGGGVTGLPTWFGLCQ